MLKIPRLTGKLQAMVALLSATSPPVVPVPRSGPDMIVGVGPDHMATLREPRRPELVVLKESPQPHEYFNDKRMTPMPQHTFAATDPGFRVRLPVPRHNFSNQTESEMDARMDAAAEKRNRKTLARLGKAK